MTRLINADALKKVFENLASDDYNVPIWYQQTVFETIDNAPTVEERLKGEWIKDIQGDTICKNCGFECLYNKEGMYSLGRYCHHCGADMRGEEE